MADQWSGIWRGSLPGRFPQQPQFNEHHVPWNGPPMHSAGPAPLMSCNVNYPFPPRDPNYNNNPRARGPIPFTRAPRPPAPKVDHSRFVGFEAEKRFPNSKERIHNVLQNATKTHHKLTYRYQRVSNRVWKASLGIPWPSAYFEVSGEGLDKKQAERRAAALALLKLEEMGCSVGGSGTTVLTKKEEIDKEDEPQSIEIPDNVISRIELLLLKNKKDNSWNPFSSTTSTAPDSVQNSASTRTPTVATPSDTSGTSDSSKEIRDVFTGSSWKALEKEQQDQLNKQLLNDLVEMQKSDNTALKQIRQSTGGLPVAKLRKDVTSLINNNQVVLVAGETGCGKTTQIPQFILDDAIQRERGSSCNIVVTQPRRIVAMSIAERVARERGEKLGKSIGYQVRLESKVPTRPGRILFCTTGVLLRKLQSNSHLSGVSHCIVDEVHERDINTDFLLVLLREMIDTCPSLKIIIMSATIDAERFCEYFANCQKLDIPGFTHPVTEYYLEEIKQMLPPTPGTSQQWLPGNQDSKRFKLANDVKTEGKVLPDVDPQLATDVILHVSRTYPEGAILCFLSGWDEIMSVHDLLMEKIPEQQRNHFVILPLHSMLSLSNQQQVFERPAKGVRKVILATNIAETSITIDDIVYVVNAGNLKEKTYDIQKKVSCLGAHWCSKANVTQRRGRAGRCSPGYCFNLFSRKQFDEMEPFQTAEMLRMSLEEIVLQAKTQRPNCTAAQFLGKALDAPSPYSETRGMLGEHEKAMENAVILLKDIGALNNKEELTALGRHMANLPVDPKIAKMIIYATVFRCVDPVLTIAAALSYRDPFLTPIKKRAEADKARAGFARGADSDHLALLNAYADWVEATRTGREREFFNTNFLHRGTLNMIEGMRHQLHSLLADARLVRRADPNHVTDMNARNLALVQAVLCAGLYPNVIKVGLGLESKGRCGKKRLKTTLRTKNDGRVAIHPSSVNNDKKTFNTKWLIYHEKVKSTQIFVRDSSTIHPIALILFAGETLTATLEKFSQGAPPSDVTVAVDGDRWMGFLCSPRAANMFQSLRGALEDMVNQTISTAREPYVFAFNTKLIESVVTLLNISPQIQR